MLDTAPSKQAAAWLESFGRALETADAEAALRLFSQDCYWRDLLAFTWNIRTMEGQPAIRAMLEVTLAGVPSIVLTFQVNATISRQ